MGEKFVPKGPKRYAHQRRGLMKMIETKGIFALLFDPGTGKALDVETEVPTPEGWTTMGALVTGDRVYAPDGSITEIIAHEPYEADAYRVVFSDGAEVVADGEHLWVTEDVKAQQRARYGGAPTGAEVRTTSEIAATLYYGGKANHRVRLTAPVEGPERPGPGSGTGWLIEPYALGVWLGDGASNVGQVYAGRQDVKALMHNLEVYGNERTRVLARDENGVTTIAFDRPISDACSRGHAGQPYKNCPICANLYYRAEKYGEPLPPRWNTTLGSRLSQLGLRGNKHVPVEYLRASARDRRELLAGLMDTDGHAGKSTVEFTSTRKALAEAVFELAASLGERVSIREGRATINGRDAGPKWRVSWTPVAVPPFRLQRKIDATPLRQKEPYRYIVKVEPVGRRLVRCLTVASETHQYLVTRAWLPTHNTMTTLDYMSILALKAKPDDAGVREVRVLVVAPLAALDTWVDQAEQYVTDSVNLWAEAMGGDRLSIRQRAEALAARGGRPFAKQSRTRVKHGPRGIHFEKALMLRARGATGPLADGPDALGVERPRLVIEVVNLDTFSSRQVTSGTTTVADVLLDAIERFSPELVVVDESHKIKGATSNASRMLARIGRRVPRRGLLTGTVMPAGPLDVYGQWRFLDPYAFGDLTADGTRKTATFDGFRRRYAEMGGYMGRNVVGYKNLDEMQRIMSINAEVARKEDALDLPPTVDVKVPVNLSSAEAKAYAEMKKGLATQLATGLHASASNRLAQMMRLRQITAGHLPDDLGNLNVLGDSKARTIASIVHDNLAGEKRVVVFTLFLHEIDMLKKVLAREGTELMVISGETDANERLRLRQRFGSDAPQRIVMIAQIKTMSLSVNELVTASHAVFGSLPQTRDDFIQARDRLNRIGQTGGKNRSVTFWYAMAPGTIDEVIYNAHETRTNLEASVLRHILGDSEAELLEAQASRRDEEEHHGQVGRLIDDGRGGVERAYGSQTEAVSPPPTPDETTTEGAA